MIQTIEIFSHLSSVQIKQMMEISLLRHYAANEIIFYQGEESEYFHFLLQGDVSVYKSNNTETMEVHRFRAPSMIAELATLKDLPFPASAEALTPCTVLKITRKPFIDLMHKDAGLGISMISSLMNKIGTLERTIEHLSAPDTMSKIVRSMLEQPHIFREQKGTQIAKMLSISPETLSRHLSKLKKEKLIAHQPHKYFEILNKIELEKYT
jgi:CRP/FNR family transcriptional regulator